MQALRCRRAHRLATIGTAGDALNQASAAVGSGSHHIPFAAQAAGPVLLPTCRLACSCGNSVCETLSWTNLRGPWALGHNVYNSNIDVPFLGLDGPPMSMFDANTYCWSVLHSFTDCLDKAVKPV